MIIPIEQSEQSAQTQESTVISKGSYQGRKIVCANCLVITLFVFCLLAALGSAIGGFVMLGTAKDNTNKKEGIFLASLGSAFTLLFCCLGAVKIHQIRKE